MNPSMTILLVLALSCGGATAAECPPGQVKKVVGQTANISVVEAGLDYLARIDTGARVTSIHAVDVEIENRSDDFAANRGRNIRFTTRNEKGQQSRIHGVIVDVASVRNAQGVEDRYVVELDLDWQGFRKRAEVNLRDRSQMSYKLLIGRNWLNCDVVVDVSASEDTIE